MQLLWGLIWTSSFALSLQEPRFWRSMVAAERVGWEPVGLLLTFLFSPGCSCFLLLWFTWGLPCQWGSSSKMLLRDRK